MPGRPTNLDSSRARPHCATIGADGGCLDIFFLLSIFSHFFLLHWETA